MLPFQRKRLRNKNLLQRHLLNNQLPLYLQLPLPDISYYPPHTSNNPNHNAYNHRRVNSRIRCSLLSRL
jgi:hypothetical protein